MKIRKYVANKTKDKTLRIYIIRLNTIFLL